MFLACVLFVYRFLATYSFLGIDYNACCSYTIVNSLGKGKKQWVKFKASKLCRKILVKYLCKSVPSPASFLVWCLLLSGDVELNPGPTTNSSSSSKSTDASIPMPV